MADDDATLGEQILNVPKADMEARVQPDSVSDHFWRETIATVAQDWQRNGWAPPRLSPSLYLTTPARSLVAPRNSRVLRPIAPTDVANPASRASRMIGMRRRL
jgi:hypothetical protein